MQSDVSDPLNIGSEHLVNIVEKVAGVTLARCYKLDAPKGVRGRNSDSSAGRRR